MEVGAVARRGNPQRSSVQSSMHHGCTVSCRADPRMRPVVKVEVAVLAKGLREDQVSVSIEPRLLDVTIRGDAGTNGSAAGEAVLLAVGARRPGMSARTEPMKHAKTGCVLPCGAQSPLTRGEAPSTTTHKTPQARNPIDCSSHYTER